MSVCYTFLLQVTSEGNVFRCAKCMQQRPLFEALSRASFIVSNCPFNELLLGGTHIAKYLYSFKTPPKQTTRMSGHFDEQ